MLENKKPLFFLSLVLTLGVLTACETRETKQDARDVAAVKTQLAQSQTGYEIVDCRLPGQVRSLGRNNVFVAPRRLIRTSKNDCAIRGGEFIAYDRSDYNTALTVWMAEAMNGDVEAQTYVGEIYEKGLAGTPDYKLAAMAKLGAARTAVAVAGEAIQLLGGYGYMTEYDVERFYRDAKTLELIGGNTVNLKNAIAKNIIGRIK